MTQEVQVQVVDSGEYHRVDVLPKSYKINKVINGLLD